MQLGPVIPILRLFDEDLTRQFYASFLGFTVDWEHRYEPNFPLYMQVSRAGCRLHLSEHYGDCSPGACVRIGVDDLDTFHAELLGKSYKYARPGIERMPWGREMKVTDPSFNRLIFFAPAPTQQ